MYFVTLIYRNLARRRARTLLTLCALSTAVAAVVALIGISRDFARSFREVYAVHGIDLVVSRKGAADRLSSAVDESVAERIRTIDGVAKAAGVLLETLSLEEERIYGVPTMGIRTDSWMLHDYRLKSGRSLAPGDAKVVWLGIQLASRLGPEAGRRVRLFEDEYAVVGVFESFSAWENSSMIMPLNELQRLTDRRGQVTYVNVVLDTLAERMAATRAARDIEALDGRLLAMPTEDFVRTDTRMRLAGAMAWMTSAIALLIGAIGMLNTMITSVFERTREIGILRAIGWKQSRVVRMVLLEAGLLSLASAVAGSLCGIVIIWGLSRAPAVSGTISPAVDWSVIARAFLMAFVIGLLGAAYPAFRAARLIPTEALRHE
jgi:putative ABC transport system permease protein